MTARIAASTAKIVNQFVAQELMRNVQGKASLRSRTEVGTGGITVPRDKCAS